MVYVAANAWYRWTMHVCRQIIVSITGEAQPILSMNLTTKHCRRMHRALYSTNGCQSDQELNIKWTDEELWMTVHP